MTFRIRKDRERSAQTEILLKEFAVAPFGAITALRVLKGEDLRRWRQEIEDDEKGMPFGLRSGKPFPPWRDTTDWLKATYYQRALGEAGPTYTFNVNLSQEVIDEALGRTESFMEFVQARLARHLKHRLGKPVSYWFAIEMTNTERLHLHGAFRHDEHDLDLVREALRGMSRVGTKAPEPRAVVIKPVSYAPGWASYSTKNVDRIKRKLRCKVVTATAEVRQQAERAYQLDASAYRDAMTPNRYAKHPLWGKFA